MTQSFSEPPRSLAGPSLFLYDRRPGEAPISNRYGGKLSPPFPLTPVPRPTLHDWRVSQVPAEGEFYNLDSPAFFFRLPFLTLAFLNKRKTSG